MSRMSRTGRAGLAGAAIAFLRSERGQRLVGEARRRLDTPENRAKARQFIDDRRRGGGTGTPRTTVRATVGRRQSGR